MPSHNFLEQLAESSLEKQKYCTIWNETNVIHGPKTRLLLLTSYRVHSLGRISIASSSIILTALRKFLTIGSKAEKLSISM